MNRSSLYSLCLIALLPVYVTVTAAAAEEALAAAGDNAFYFDHMIEYDKDNYSAKIYLEKEGEQFRVYSMKVSVY